MSASRWMVETGVGYASAMRQRGKNRVKCRGMSGETDATNVEIVSMSASVSFLPGTTSVVTSTWQPVP